VASEDKKEQRAGLFALYCLYGSQPTKTADGTPHSPVQIAVSKEDLARFVDRHRYEMISSATRVEGEGDGDGEGGGDPDTMAVLSWFHQTRPFFFVGHRKGAPSATVPVVQKAAKNDPAVLGEEEILDGMATVSDPRLMHLQGLYGRARDAAGLGNTVAPEGGGGGSDGLLVRLPT